MKVTTEIDDDDLDTRFPDPDDGDDTPAALIMVMVRAPDGMGYNAAVQLHDSLIGPDAIAEALVSALHGAARTYSPAAARSVEQWLAIPPDLDAVQGGDA